MIGLRNTTCSHPLACMWNRPQNLTRITKFRENKPRKRERGARGGIEEERPWKRTRRGKSSWRRKKKMKRERRVPRERRRLIPWQRQCYVKPSSPYPTVEKMKRRLEWRMLKMCWFSPDLFTKLILLLTEI